MAALKAGVPAPNVALPLVGGGSFNLGESLKRGPVLLAFFKVTCPVCQMAFPFIERIFKATNGGSQTVQFVGIVQNEPKDAQAFMREYGVTFPVALDDTNSYPASNAYGLTNVPSLFLVGPNGRIEVSSVGFSKRDFEQIAIIAGASKPLFTAQDAVPDFKAG